MPNRGLRYGLLSVAGGGLAGAVIGIAATVGSNWLGYLLLPAGVIFVVALGVGPWFALGRRPAWWLGSGAGVIAGFLASVFTVITLFGLGLNICITDSGCPPPPPFPPAENLMLFSILIGGIGAGQGLTLRGWSRKLTWLITTVLAGAVFGEGLQIASTTFGSNPATPALGPSIAAGLSCGAILGVGALLLRRRAIP